jgi:exodeoxyribonuclease V beta subunit
LHEVLERCDFSRVGDEATARVIGDALRRHGLDDAAAHAAGIDPTRAVAAMLADLAESELPETRFRLRSIGRDSRLNEWQFYLPMASVSQSAFAECFARHAEGALRDDYPRELLALGSAGVRGFLMGFVDLVFTHGERWYVLDWKSNHLGNSLGDYDERSLGRVMREDHYVLQYHLYALALHRYLEQRLRSYDYDRNFGGVYYCFLRAVRARKPGGWHFDRPGRALIDALDALVRGEA